MNHAPNTSSVMRPCGYCGSFPAHDHDGIWACRAHEDLPELERARTHLEWRARRVQDGHRFQWTQEDAHAAKVLLRATA